MTENKPLFAHDEEVVHFGHIRYGNERLLHLHRIRKQGSQIALKEDLFLRNPQDTYGMVFLEKPDYNAGLR